MRKRTVAALVLVLTLLPSMVAYGATVLVGGFEIDGDFLPTAQTSNLDWANVGGVTRVDDPSNVQTDDAFVKGNKEEGPDGWIFGQQKSPGKDDLTRIYAANEVTPGHAFLWLAFERL